MSSKFKDTVMVALDSSYHHLQALDMTSGHPLGLDGWCV